MRHVQLYEGFYIAHTQNKCIIHFEQPLGTTIVRASGFIPSVLISASVVCPCASTLSYRMPSVSLTRCKCSLFSHEPVQAASTQSQCDSARTRASAATCQHARQLIGSPLHGMNSQHRDSVAITTQPMRGDSCTRSRARPRRCHIQAADSEPTTPHTPHTTHHTIQRNTTTDKQQQHATMRLSSVEGKRLR